MRAGLRSEGRGAVRVPVFRNHVLSPIMFCSLSRRARHVLPPLFPHPVLLHVALVGVGPGWLHLYMSITTRQF